jgi:UDP-glucose:(heptosyl)LPS alpha-1,3-glucosyltransferase
MSGTRPVRVAVIAENYGTAGGSERFVQEVTERLAQTGRFEFHVFANRWSSSCTAVRFHKVPRIKFPRFMRPWFFTTMAQRQVARGKFDLVHSHWPTPKAEVFTTHGAPHGHWLRKVLRRRAGLFDHMMMRIERRMIRDGSRAIFMPVSAFLKDRFGDTYGELPGRWIVNGPGVDADRFVPDAVARADVRSRFGIPMHARVVLFVGMNFETKGLGRLIEGIIHARRLQPAQDIRLLVVGRGRQEPFARIAAQAGMQDAVIFAGLQSSGIERFYSAADAFALVSEFETFGMVVLEAMAARLPVLISDQMGVRELVRDGEQGFVVACAASGERIGERVVAMLEPDAQRRMGLAGRAFAERQSWQRVADAVRQAYEAQLQATSRGAL